MDIELYCQEQGAGFPLVLLHGNGESHEYFAHQIDHFAPKHRVLALDTRGHGKSPRGEGEFSIARFAEDLHDFLCARGIEQADVLGFSDGGNIALAFALRWPEMVRKLVLNGANLSPAGVRPLVQAPIVLGYHIARLFAAKSAGARHNAEMLGLMVNEPHVDPAQLAALSMPVLVIAGTRDMIARRHTELIARSIPGARLVLLDGDHFIAAKAPDAFNRAVEEFLGEE